MDIPNRDVFSEPIESEYDVSCYTDGSMINEHVGAGIVIKGGGGGGGGVLRQDFLEIDFLVVSDREE